MNSLFVYQGPDQGCLFDIDCGLYTIGRDSSNAIQLRDMETADRHAEL